MEDRLDKLKNEKLKHDFLNSIVIISNLAKYAKSFSERVARLSFDDGSAITARQLELFQKSMEAIRSEAAKIEITFYKALGEEVFSSVDKDADNDTT